MLDGDLPPAAAAAAEIETDHDGAVGGEEIGIEELLFGNGGGTERELDAVLLKLAYFGMEGTEREEYEEVGNGDRRCGIDGDGSDDEDDDDDDEFGEFVSAAEPGAEEEAMAEAVAEADVGPIVGANEESGKASSEQHQQYDGSTADGGGPVEEMEEEKEEEEEDGEEEAVGQRQRPLSPDGDDDGDDGDAHVADTSKEGGEREDDHDDKDNEGQRETVGEKEEGGGGGDGAAATPPDDGPDRTTPLEEVSAAGSADARPEPSEDVEDGDNGRHGDRNEDTAERRDEDEDAAGQDQNPSASSSSTSTSESSSATSSHDDHRHPTPPLDLLDLSAARTADLLLRTFPLAESCTAEGRFTRRVQLGLMRLAEEERRAVAGDDKNDDGEGGSCLTTNEGGGEGKWEEEEDTDFGSSLGTNDDGDNDYVDDAGQRSESVAERTSLPPEFYASDNDDGDDDDDSGKDIDPAVLSTLLSVPWDERPLSDPAYVHGPYASFDKMGPLDDYFAERLSDLDEALGNVTRRLVRRARGGRVAFEIARGMRRVQDIDLDVARAGLDAEAAADGLRRARCASDEAGGLLGGLVLLREADNRDRLGLVRTVLDEVDDLIRTEEELMASPPVCGREYGDRIRVAVDLRESVLGNGGGRLARLDCLDPLRGRVRTIMKRMVGQVEDSLAAMMSSCCDGPTLPVPLGEEGTSICSGSFSAEEYGQLLRARLILFEHRQPEGNHDCSKDAEAKVSHPDQNEALTEALSSWSRCILGALRFEADKCLARALLDPTDTAEGDADDSESDYKQDLLTLRVQLSQIRYCDEDAKSALRSVLQNLLTIRFDFEGHKNSLPWIYHKLCVLLAEVMHVHYLVVRWHVAQVEERCDFPNNVGQDGSASTDGGIPCSAQTPRENEGRGNGSPAASDVVHGNYAGQGSLTSKWDLTIILEELQSSRLVFWKQCESVLIRLLEQYLVQSTKQKTLRNEAGDDNTGESKWAVQLEGLHDILQLTNQMATLGQEFVVPNAVAAKHGAGSIVEGEWIEKLSQVFRIHLRGVHVEAMNVMGAMLVHETWQLLPIEVDSNFSGDNEYKAKHALEDMLETLCPLHTIDSRILGSSKQRCWENRFHGEKEGQFPQFVSAGNPFLSLACGSSQTDCTTQSTSSTFACSDDVDPHNDDDSSASTKTNPSVVPEIDPTSCEGQGQNEATHRAELYSAISSFVSQGANNQCMLPIATQSGINGLAKWTARLLKIMKKLPLIANDAANVISNIYDLYLLTVLRFCAGTAANEAVLLGLPEEFSGRSAANDRDEIGSGSQHGKHSRKASYGSSSPTSRNVSQANNPISTTTEADICSPLPCQTEKTEALRSFVCRGQESLSGMVNLTKVEEWGSLSTSKAEVNRREDVKSAVGSLERRTAAAVSCLYVAALLDAALFSTKLTLQKSLASSLQILTRNDDASEFDAEVLSTYVHSVVSIAPALTSMASRIACVRAVKGKMVVLEVMMVGRSWQDSRFLEHANDYVDRMCDRSALLWGHLSCSATKLPKQGLRMTWKNIVEGSLLSLLEGFSKITICSTEGRALMSMDLAAYSAGVTSQSVMKRLQHLFDVGDPPPTVPRDLMLYVDMYIKAFYYPEEDMFKWIVENHQSYHLNHALALVTCGAAGNTWRGGQVTSMTQRVEALYISHG